MHIVYALKALNMYSEKHALKKALKVLPLVDLKDVCERSAQTQFNQVILNFKDKGTEFENLASKLKSCEDIITTCMNLNYPDKLQWEVQHNSKDAGSHPVLAPFKTGTGT